MRQARNAIATERKKKSKTENIRMYNSLGCTRWAGGVARSVKNLNSNLSAEPQLQTQLQLQLHHRPQAQLECELEFEFEFDF